VKLIVGLGNPDKRYEHTRHNAGFMVVDRLRRRHAPSERPRARFAADTVEARIAGDRCLLLKPMTYMNRSGQSVQQAVAFYKINPADDLLVVCDDLALPVGFIRLRARGGTGGHNGLADISRALGSDEFCRLRVGIGAKPPHMDQADYVLSRFTPEEIPDLERAIDSAADAAEVFITDGITAAMNRFNQRITEPAKRNPTPSPRPEASEETHPGWLGAQDETTENDR